MFRLALTMVLAWSLLGGVLLGQEVQRGKLKKLDVEQRRVIVTVDGRDRQFTLTEQTQVPGAAGRDLAERFRDFKEGADVFFNPGRGDDRDKLVGIKLAEGPGQPEAGPSGRPKRGAGTHQSPSGQRKVGKLLLDFFKSDSTTRPWFLRH